MELLLKIFHMEYIKMKFPRHECSLSLLAGLEGSHETFFKDKKAKNNGGIKFGTSGAKFIPDNFALELKSPGSILENDMLFSTFVNLVMSDVINLDEYPTFVDHCKNSSVYLESLNKMKSRQRVKAGYNLEKGESPANRLQQEEVNYVNKQILAMAKGKIGEMTWQGKALVYLQQQKIIKNVTVHENKLKSYIAEGLQQGGKKTEGVDALSSQLLELLENIPEKFSDYKNRKKQESAKKKTNAGLEGNEDKEEEDINNSDVQNTPRKSDTMVDLTDSPEKLKTPSSTIDELTSKVMVEQLSERKRKADALEELSQKQELERNEKAKRDEEKKKKSRSEGT